MAVLDEVLRANEAYVAEFGRRGELAQRPARGVAVLICMDARLDPARFAGLSDRDAHVIRNAGGRASDDAIRSLVISHKLLGTSEWFVIHHSECGMESITNEVMADLLAQSAEGRNIDWLTISDRDQSVVDDVRTLRNHPLVPAGVVIHGFVYDVKTGRLLEVAEATEAGRPS